MAEAMASSDAARRRLRQATIGSSPWYGSGGVVSRLFKNSLNSALVGKSVSGFGSGDWAAVGSGAFGSGDWSVVSTLAGGWAGDSLFSSFSSSSDSSS